MLKILGGASYAVQGLGFRAYSCQAGLLFARVGLGFRPFDPHTLYLRSIPPIVMAP